MKLRESGMPEEAYWESLFDVTAVLDRLGLDAGIANVLELGCGYGTFTIPVARRITGIRPRPGQIAAWAEATGMPGPENGAIDLPPWHYGWRLRRLDHR